MNCICVFENNLNFFATGWRNRSVVADHSVVARCLPKQRTKLRRSEVFVECPTEGISLRFSIYGPPSPVNTSLGHSFSACFGCIALSTTILLGLLSGETTESILTRCLILTATFAAMGWLFGQIANSVIRQSVEMNDRGKFEKIREKRKNTED